MLSGLPPTADVRAQWRHFRLVPTAAVSRRSKEPARLRFDDWDPRVEEVERLMMEDDAIYEHYRGQWAIAARSPETMPNKAIHITAIRVTVIAASL
jgi:hypothetical protein